MISPDLLAEAENEMDALLEETSLPDHNKLSLMDIDEESTPSNSSVSVSPDTPEDTILNDTLMSPLSPISPTSPTTTKRITRSAARKMTKSTFDASHREGTPTEFGACIFRQTRSNTQKSKKQKKRPKAPRKPPAPRKPRGTKRKRKEVKPLMDCPARHGLKKQLTPDNRVFECDQCNKV